MIKLRLVKLSLILITRQLQASADDARAALAKAELDMNRYKALCRTKCYRSTNL